MPKAEWDPTGRFIVLRLARQDRVEPPEASLIAERLLSVAGEHKRLPVLIRVDGSLPPGLDWRIAWMSFVVKNRRELRIALVRDGFATEGASKWGALAGVELRDFNGEAEAVAWLTGD